MPVLLKSVAKPLSKKARLSTNDGEVLAQHNGIHQFTVGQRRGLGIAYKEPLYVTDIDAVNHRVVVGSQKSAAKETMWVDRCHWMVPSYAKSREFEVQIRYRGRAVPIVVEEQKDLRMLLRFKSGHHIPSPGQAAVFYDGDRLLGGGWIANQPRQQPLQTITL